MERKRGLCFTTYLSGTWVEYPRGCDGSKGLPHCLAHPEPLSLTCPWKQYQWRASSSCLPTELELACADAELALLHQEFCNNKKVLILLTEYPKALPCTMAYCAWGLYKLCRVLVARVRDAKVHTRHSIIGLIGGPMTPCYCIKHEISHGIWKVLCAESTLVNSPENLLSSLHSGLQQRSDLNSSNTYGEQYFSRGKAPGFTRGL